MVADFPDYGPAVRAGLFTLAGSGVRVVAVAGTRIALRAATSCQQVMVKARRANAGIVYLGGSGVTNDETAGTGGLQLSAGDMVVFPVDNLANVFINGAAGDGVSYAWWT